jgi:hypothetical protein
VNSLILAGFFHAGRDSGAGDHDAPEPARHQDRRRSELDYEVNRRAESEIQRLSRKLNLVDEKIDDIADLIRKND